MPETLRGKFALSNIAMMTVDRNFFLRNVHETVFSEVSVTAVFSEFDCCFCGVQALIIIIYPVLADWNECDLNL